MEHPGDGDRPDRKAYRGAERRTAATSISASGPGVSRSRRTGDRPAHHYTFEIFALDTKLDVPAGTDAFETRTSVLKAMQGHVLGKAVYVGLFRRPQ